MIPDEQAGWNSAWEKATVAEEIGTLAYPWVQPALQFIAQHLPAQARVLEAGCGPGRFLHWLGGLGHEAVGLDCSLSALRMAQGFSADFAVLQGDVRRLPIRDASFDGYLSLGVIEHFESPDETLREAWRVLRPGGTLIVSVPCRNLFAAADEPLKAVYRRLRGIPPPKPDEHEPPGRYYGFGELRDAVRRSGFAIEATLAFGHAYTLHSFCGVFRRRGRYHDVTALGRWLGAMLGHIAPRATAFAIFLAARKD